MGNGKDEAMNFRYFLKDASKIDAEDVIMYRREVFDDLVVSRAEAEAVFELNDAVSVTCKEWDQFFVEVMTDYVVNQSRPEGYVSETKAEWLIKQVSQDNHVQADSELELLVKVIERGNKVPDNLCSYALNEVAYAVLEGNGKLLCNENLTKGVIGAPEAKLIRRIMYGPGEGGRVAISHAEVETLFDLNDQTVETQNHPEWNDVFVKAVAAHLMMASGYSALPPGEVLRREAWLDDTTIDPAGMLVKTLNSFGALMRGESWQDAFQSDHNATEEAWRQRNRIQELDNIRSEPVEASEAKWLAARIGQDGVQHENEKALLSYLKKESPLLSESLNALLEKVA